MNAELQAARLRWASIATERLTSVTEAVAHLRRLFEIESDTPPVTATAVASELINVCAGLLEWLSVSHAPRGLGKAGGELGAAAGVYRNAAVAFEACLMQTSIRHKVGQKPAPSCWNRVIIMSRRSSQP